MTAVGSEHDGPNNSDKEKKSNASTNSGLRRRMVDKASSTESLDLEFENYVSLARNIPGWIALIRIITILTFNLVDTRNVAKPIILDL